ncbi:hypothetical protein SVAN01_11098 [Stagonosporopsis vannaccii]|nr:hypothetical protein SVAN01_11098 [Stagonosporopsis vannaccii]
MRFNSIPVLAAVLSLGASGISSSVVPETREVGSSARLSAEAATLCITDLCAKKRDEKHTRAQCGPVVLSVSNLGAASSVEACVSQFNYLFSQYTERGISHIEKGLYTISAYDDSKPAANEKRAKPPKGKTNTSKKPIATTTAKLTAVKTISSKAASITSTSSLIDPTGSRTSSKVSGSATPSASACPLPRKGKNGKPIQRRCAGDQFYAKRDLLVKKVTHWKFNTMGDVSTYNADANAKSVLQKMKKNGQLDVVKVSSGDLTMVGNVNDPDVVLSTMRGTDPNSFTKKGGHYLLTNGGFFQHMETRPRSFEPAGIDTMVKTAAGTVQPFEEAYDVPAEYKDFYARIDGSEGTRIYSGPNLKQSIPGVTAKSGIWKYNENDPILVGRLSHASEPNERIALVSFGTTHYSIAYTAKARSDGVDTNTFKTIIDLFFSKMGETGKSISSSTRAVCLDGGPSISMTWNEGATMEKLTLGGAGDSTPAPGANGRKVSNLVKITAK